MTQKELAGLAGLRQQTVSDYESNRRTPTLDNACKLAKALDTTVEVIDDGYVMASYLQKAEVRK